MTREHISGLDLNLLLVLHALLEEGGVSRAAKHLGRTQPAVSRSLQRLREMLDDPLLVRTRHGMRATARGLALRDPVRRLVADASAIVRGRVEFDPATASRSFTLAASDATELTLVAPLLQALEARAPGVDVVTLRESRGSQDALEDGELDLLLTPSDLVAESGLRTQALYPESFACVLRADHPVFENGTLDLDAYCRLRHALSAPMGQPGGLVDDALRGLGRKRRVAFTAPSFLVVGQAVAQTDFVATLPRHVATKLAPGLNLAVVPPPLTLPTFTLAQFWHERRHHDPGHAWLRGLIREILAR